MRVFLFASAAAVALFAGAPAMAQSVGSVGATYVRTEVSAPGFNRDGDSYVLDGLVAFDVTPEWTVTFDGAVTDDGLSDVVFGDAIVHVSRKVGSDLRVGGFVGGVAVHGDMTWGAGVSVQKYVGDWTFTGQAAYGDSDLYLGNLWSLNARGSYFITSNLRIDAGLSYTDVDSQYGALDSFSANVGGEYQLGASPFSVTASYSRAKIDLFDQDIDNYNVGIRYSFGGDLRARETSGATLGSITQVFGGFFGF